MGKGSKRRRARVDDDTFASNWDRIFSKKNGMIGKIQYAIKVSTAEGGFYYVTEDTGKCQELIVEKWPSFNEAEEFANTLRASGVGSVEVVEWLE